MMSERSKCLLVTVAAVIAVSAFLASREITTSILGRPSLISVTGFIALGPLAGWFLATRDGHVLSALWSLLPATILSVGPLILWYSSRRVVLLVVAAVAWVAAGYFYSVVIWV